MVERGASMFDTGLREACSASQIDTTALMAQRGATLPSSFWCYAQSPAAVIDVLLQCNALSSYLPLPREELHIMERLIARGAPSTVFHAKDAALVYRTRCTYFLSTLMNVTYLPNVLGEITLSFL